MSMQNGVQGSTVFKIIFQEANNTLATTLKETWTAKIQPKVKQRSLHHLDDHEEFSHLLPSRN